MNETMGQIIRRLRKERNLTQEELAEQLNITYQAVSRWESGTGMPDISQIVPLSNVFGVTTDVLFGKDGTNGEEAVESFIRETEKKICNPPVGVDSFAWSKECTEDVQKMLEVDPNNYKLLAYSLGHISCLLDEYRYSDKMKDKTEEIQKWENESIRQANIILNHCTNSRYLNEANKWMAVLYKDMGNYVRMLEYAEKITVFDPYAEGGDLQAEALNLLGRKDEGRRERAKNIYNALEYLHDQLFMIGKSWRTEGKFEEAYACHRLFPDIYDLIVGERKDEMPFCSPHYDYEHCAIICMNMKRHEEAIDWLEKMVKHERIKAKNFNVITETKIPYLYGKTKHFSANSYDKKDTLLPSFAYDVFDPIRENERFKAILADAEAFEQGN